MSFDQGSKVSSPVRVLGTFPKHCCMTALPLPHRYRLPQRTTVTQRTIGALIRRVEPNSGNLSARLFLGARPRNERGGASRVIPQPQARELSVANGADWEVGERSGWAGCGIILTPSGVQTNLGISPKIFTTQWWIVRRVLSVHREHYRERYLAVHPREATAGQQLADPAPISGAKQGCSRGTRKDVVLDPHFRLVQFPRPP